MDDDKIISLSDRIQDSTFASPEQVLESALADYAAGKQQATKLAILYLHEDGNNTRAVSWSLAQLNVVDLVFLLESAKHEIINNAGRGK